MIAPIGKRQQHAQPGPATRAVFRQDLKEDKRNMGGREVRLPDEKAGCRL